MRHADLLAPAVRALAWAAVVGLLCLPGHGQTVPTLSRQLTELCQRPAFAGATWGVAVVRADSRQVLFQLNAHQRLKPASCAKLATVAMALDRWGPNHRLRTELLPDGPVRGDGELQGNLIVIGHGDFSFSTRFTSNPGETSLEPFVEALRRAGIRRVNGALLADRSHFPAPRYGNGWTWDDLAYPYGAAVGALNVDDNLLTVRIHPGRSTGEPATLELPSGAAGLHLDIRGVLTADPTAAPEIESQPHWGERTIRWTGRVPANGTPWTTSVPVPDPDRYFVQRLHAQLQTGGIPVTGGYDLADASRRKANPRPGTAPPIAVLSRPMSDLVRSTLKSSQNQYAELLLLQCGAAETPVHQDEDLESRGLRALRRFLARCGIPESEALLDDGAGLSRSSLVTANALVQLLLAMDRHPHADVFREGLPIAGIDGTLRTRFRGSPAQGNLRAKTGTLRYVHTLSGFVTNAAGNRLAFALLLNAYPTSPGAPSAREAVDAAADLIARSRE